MGIDFKDSKGNKVGYINDSDIINIYGKRVGYISNNDIKNSSGSRVGYINGNGILDNFGNRVGYINGSDIINNYGNRIGYAANNASNIDKAAAALLLFGLENLHNETSSESVSEGGGWGVVAAVVIMGIWKVLKGFVFLFIRYFSDGAFDFKQTATRKEYWIKWLLGLLILVITIFISMAIVFGKNLESLTSLIVIGIIILFLLVPLVAVSVRRMHDIGNSGWWILIPFVSFIMCGFFPSNIKENLENEQIIQTDD